MRSIIIIITSLSLAMFGLGIAWTARGGDIEALLGPLFCGIFGSAIVTGLDYLFNNSKETTGAKP